MLLLLRKYADCRNHCSLRANSPLYWKRSNISWRIRCLSSLPGSSVQFWYQISSLVCLSPTSSRSSLHFAWAVQHWELTYPLLTWLMCFKFPFCKLTEINEWDIACLCAGRSHDKIVVVVGHGDEVVDLVLLEFECLDDVLDLQTEQIDKENFIVECHYDFVQPYFDLLYLRTKIKVCDYLLPLCIV